MEATPERPMNLVNSIAIFTSRHSEERCWPMGVPEIQIVPSATGGSQAVRIPKQQIEFQRHRYQTKDAKIARALVLDETNFEEPWGWRLEPASLPEEIREFYPGLERETKKRIVLLLIEGEETARVFSTLDSSQAATSKRRPGDGAPQEVEHSCPVPGCGVKTTGGDNARAELVRHVHLMHPTYQP